MAQTNRTNDLGHSHSAPAHTGRSPRKNARSPRPFGLQTIRRALFWAHLVSGLVAGAFILVMSVTGVVLAFESEILDFIDRDVRRLTPPTGASPMPLDALLAKVLAEHPELAAGTLSVPSAPDEAYRLSARGGAALYVDPYTGRATPLPSSSAHHALHVVEEIHRFLGLEGDAQPIGKLIQGSANLAFVFLCLSGLWLWFPRKWTRNALRPLLRLVKTKSARARDFNLHAVFGIWSLLALLVISASALPISFAWAHELLCAAFGEQAPAERGFGMLRVPPAPVAAPEPGQARLSLEEVRRVASGAYPGHDALIFSLAASRPGEAERPLDVHVLMPDLFATRGRIMLQIDPYRGAILSSVAFADRSPGLRARVWARFLHTGEAFGLVGKLIATLATAASSVLVVTGVTLFWRRRMASQA
jgi:uncharacterized iron-regulated membrane protein